MAPPPSVRPSRSGLPRGFAALIGVLAVAAALGVGHLLAGWLSPGSSPFLAVADTVIRLSPSWLTEFGKSLGPELDKLLLQVGVAVAVALVAVVAGLASRRAARPGLAVVAGLGVLGLLAVVLGPVFTLLDLVAPVVALVTGVAAFGWLHTLAARTYEPGEPGSGPVVSRRNVLIGSSAAVGLGAIGAGLGGQALAGNVGDSRAQVTRQLAAARVAPAPPVPPGADFAGAGTPTFITSNADFYRVDVALRIPATAAADWSMRVHGMVDRELTLTFADLLRRPLVERTITMTCVSNEVGGPYVSTADFIGVDLGDLLREVGVQPGADQVLSTGADGGWTAGTPVEVLLEPGRGAMLAIGMNGEALPPEHGFPVRMVVPGLYGFVSATKWLTDLEVTTFDAASAYWRRRGWGTFAPIKTQSRIDVPRPFVNVPAGRVTVAGIAWSQPVGISRVEARVDRGPWQDAELSTEVSGVTWRMWKTDFDFAPGARFVEVRATDRNGNVQTDALANPIPDGATGWHSRRITAT